MGDPYNTVEGIYVAPRMQQDSPIAARHGPLDIEIYAHQKERDKPSGLANNHGNTQLWADPYNMGEGIFSSHHMKQDGRIWLSIVHGDTCSLADQ